MTEIIFLNYFQDLMVQRPHHLLKQFAKSDYQAVLYNINGKSGKVTEPFRNCMIYDGVFPTLPKKGKRVLWLSYPPLYKEIGKYQEDLLVYDCIDYPGEQFEYWQRGVSELREKADVIFTTSRALFEYNSCCREKTFLCSNGVDFDYFAGVNQRILMPPKDMQNIKRPIVGYIGAVADWIDWNLIQYLAEANKFSLVFIGPLFGMKQIPVVHDNVFFLGRKDYNALADYLSCFDVCMIPFKINKLTDACNPVKMYEYLCMGKPVVTTDLSECRIDAVRHSKSNQKFYRNIIDLLEPQSEAQIQMRIDFARQNSWEHRVTYIREIIEPILNELK